MRVYSCTLYNGQLDFILCEQHFELMFIWYIETASNTKYEIPSEFIAYYYAQLLKCTFKWGHFFSNDENDSMKNDTDKN